MTDECSDNESPDRLSDSNVNTEVESTSSDNGGSKPSPVNPAASARPENNETSDRRKRPSFLAVTFAVSLVIIILLLGFLIFSTLTAANPPASDIVGPLLAIVGLIVFSLVYQVWVAHRWRQSLLRDDGVALVPERWGQVLQGLTVENVRVREAVNSESKLVLQNIEAFSHLSDTVITFKSAIDQRDQELKQLKEGYDYSILKSYLTKIIRLNETVLEISSERADDADFEFLRRSLAAILEDCHIEIISPKAGSDARELGKLIDDNVKFETTTDPDLVHRVARILAPAYVYDPDAMKQVLRPAKVVVYQLSPAEVEQ